MEHTLYSDKADDFECVLSLEGATFTKSFARLIIETASHNLAFNGTIDEHGNCVVPIRNLKSVFPTESRGKIMLEIVADDTWFKPWEENVVIKPSKKLVAEGISIGAPVKPVIKLSTIKTPSPEKVIVQEEIAEEPSDIDIIYEAIRKKGITGKSLKEDRAGSIRVMSDVIKSYGVIPDSKVLKQIVQKL